MSPVKQTRNFGGLARSKKPRNRATKLSRMSLVQTKQSKQTTHKKVPSRCHRRCLIIIADIFSAGVCTFKSNHSGTWFAYLLRFKAVPPDRLKATELQTLIDAVAVTAPVPDALNGSAIMPVRLAAAIDPDIAGDDLVLAPVAEPNAETDVEDDDTAEPPVAEPLDAAPFADVAGDDAPPEHDWPDVLEGVKLKRVAGRCDGTWSYHARLAVVCPNPEHRRCSKSRSTELMVGTFGVDAPIFFGCMVAGSREA